MRIQALIFISGYLLGYTSKRKNDALQFKSCVVKKVKRLLLPSIVFSILYFMLFYDSTGPLLNTGYSILNGCGHMWFLPMLFWCFVGVWLTEEYRVNPLLTLIVALGLSILPCPTLPFRINSTFTYFIYFYVGFGLQRGYFDFLKPRKTLIPILVLSGIYVVFFYLFVILNWKCNIGGVNSIFMKVISLSFTKTISAIMSLSGLFAAFYSAHFFVIGKYKLPDWMIKVSTYCYGVYICQQFILQYIYYHTPLAAIVGVTALPWIALIITLFASLFITHLMLRTKTGRFLIG